MMKSLSLPKWKATLLIPGGNDRLVIEGLPGDFSMSADKQDLVLTGVGQSITRKSDARG